MGFHRSGDSTCHETSQVSDNSSQLQFKTYVDPHTTWKCTELLMMKICFRSFYFIAFRVRAQHSGILYFFKSVSLCTKALLKRKGERRVER